MSLQRVTKGDIDAMLSTPMGCNWPRYRKVTLTQAMRMNGPFTVKTREGELTCEDGYLAIDAHGWPYPIAADEFDRIYTPNSASDKLKHENAALATRSVASEPGEERTRG